MSPRRIADARRHPIPPASNSSRTASGSIQSGDPRRTPKGTRPARGFTLIEIVIALAIVMMILGMAALNMNALNTERKLRDVTATLRDFARRARAEALVQQRGFQIAFLPDGFAVQGFVVPDEEEQALGRLIADEEFEPRIENFKTYEMLEEMQLEVHRFGEDDWKPAAGQTWRFEHTGICEPISVRVKNADGYIELQFNPLTAAVEDEAYEIR